MDDQSSVSGRVLRPPEPVRQQSSTTQPGPVSQQPQRQPQTGVNQPPPPPPGVLPQQPQTTSNQQPGVVPQQPQTATPVQSPPGVGLASKFPIKKILIAVGVLVAIFAIIFIVTRFMGREEPVSGPVKLVWWGHSWDQEVLEPFLTEYKTETGVEIEYVQQSTRDYHERLANSLAQGTGPDIFEYHNTWVPMYSGDLFPIPTDVMSVEEFSRTFFPVVVSDMSAGDSIYGMPMAYDGLTLFVNDSIFSTAQEEYPTDWDDVVELANRMTQTSGSQIIQSGLAMGSTINVDHWPEIIALLMLQNGVDLYNPVGENAQAALEYYMQFGALGVWDETLPDSTKAFAQGKVAMLFAPTHRAEEISQLNPNLKFRAIDLPQLPQDDPDIPGNTYATYWVNGVSNQSSNAIGAWKFLVHMSDRDTQRRLFEVRSKAGLGFVYPRNDLVPLLVEDKYFGPVVKNINSASSWYLADYTFDGMEGINSLMNSVFELALIDKIYTTLPSEVASTLSIFGATSR